MWQVEYLKEAIKDLMRLDHSQRLQVLKAINKAINKVASNPLPQNEGGYGIPLGNKNSIKLAGYFKIKLKRLGLRVVYKLVREKEVMKIIIISARADDEVYLLAQKRIDK
ncbi:type II toxin-antitoxin system RelE/ParE family toxin [Carboxydocella sp. JDF658]|uniref:type II toxin-antitoxin system RelE family toxin n=1 Tax=Carboxydocella sp. JDF658 TaxID=1926600 RepID=UPI0009ACBCCF|nr:type II toxin-antitoxin system RelE/ParE family toxin [Carboxydocella sp. JDF658]GAW30636.1 toxin RelE [Carboxydocella sp. JDF658]